MFSKVGNVVLSRIETLPDAAVPLVRRLFDAVRERRQSQEAMLAEMNAELASLGLDPISRSSFNRWVQRVRHGDATRPRVPLSDRRVEISATTAKLVVDAAEAIRRDMEANQP